MSESIRKAKVYLSEGCEGDAGIDEVRCCFQRSYNGVDLSALFAYLKVAFADDTTDKFLMTKQVDENEITLSLPLSARLTKRSGTAIAQVSLESQDGTVVIGGATSKLRIKESVTDAVAQADEIPSAVIELQRELQGDIDALEDDISSIETFMSGDFVNTVNSRSGNVVLTKADVGLDSVDNTSDLSKPVSTATQAALNGKQNVIDGTHKLSADLTEDGTTNKVFTASEKTKLSGIEAGAEVNDVDSVNGQTGTVILDADDISDTNTTNKFVTASEKTTWNNKQDALTFDNAPTENSDNPVKSGGVYTALSGKQDALTFDSAPTENSDNPVKSGGVKTAIDTAISAIDISSYVPTSRTVAGNALSADITASTLFNSIFIVTDEAVDE